MNLVHFYIYIYIYKKNVLDSSRTTTEPEYHRWYSHYILRIEGPRDTVWTSQLWVHFQGRNEKERSEDIQYKTRSWQFGVRPEQTVPICF